MKDFVPKEKDIFRSRLIYRFSSIKSRCNNTNNKNYSIYGGRGIKCEFKSFNDFYSWCLEQGIEDGLDVDRIDNNGNYSRTNCQLITKEENTLKQEHINLTVNDVMFIRSSDFVWNKHRSNYKCSDNTIKNILKGEE